MDALKNTKDSEFQNIFNKFSDQLSKMQENSSIIFSKVCMLKDIRKEEKTCNPAVPAKEEIIDKLNQYIDSMIEYNMILSKAKSGLMEIVG
jgi:hypothetical protein